MARAARRLRARAAGGRRAGRPGGAPGGLRRCREELARWRRWRGCSPTPTRRGSSWRREPPPELGARIAATIEGERQQREQRRRRRLFGGFAFGGATAAAAAAVLVLFVFGGGSAERRPAGRVRRLPRASASTRRWSPMPTAPRSTCTCTGSPRERSAASGCGGRGGVAYPAGTFRYRWGDDSDAVLSSALDISRTRAVVVRRRRSEPSSLRWKGAEGDGNDRNEEEST